ncbi:MAG: SRPBCC family protein [Calditrichota bacterium]
MRGDPELIPANPAQICVRSYRCNDTDDRIACVAGIVNAPVETVWQVISDYSAYQQLIPRCTRSEIVSPAILSAIGQTPNILQQLHPSRYRMQSHFLSDTVLLFSEIDIIFPVGKVRSLLRVIADSVSNTIAWNRIVGDISVYEGTWILIPHGLQTTAICATRYRLNVWLPPLLINSGVRCYFPRIITQLRNRVKECQSDSLSAISSGQ